jgi:trigger factor
MVLPELNDDFAMAFGIEENGLEGLKKEVTENMQRELKQFISSSLKTQVFDGLLEKNPVEVPQKLVEGEIERLKKQATETNASLSDEAALRTNAERRVKLSVLVSEVMKQNRLQPDPDRVREAIENIAASYEKPEEVIQYYYGNQEMLSGVQSSIIEDQVVNWVIENESIDLEEEATTFEKLVEAAKQA